MMRVLILVGGTDGAHDLLGAAQNLQRILGEAYVPAAVGVGLNRFHNPWAPVRNADVYVIYTMGGSVTEADQQALDKIVREGKGAVFLHASNVPTSDIKQEEHRLLFDLIGSRFTGHDDFGRFTVEMGEPHPITAGVRDFAIDDEPYVAEWVGAPCPILAWRTASEERIPVLYARERDLGRVCYLALGHDLRAWGNPAFRRLLVQATFWAGRAEREDIYRYRQTLWPKEALQDQEEI